MPRVVESSRTAKRGVNFVRDIVERSNCIFHKIELENDLGIDALIELVRDHEPANTQLAVQIKSGDSYLDKNTRQCRIPIGSHRSYWKNHPLPVFGLVYIPSLDSAYWVDIKLALAANESANSIGFRAASSNQFSLEYFERLFIPLVLRQSPDLTFDEALRLFKSKNIDEVRIGLAHLFRNHVNRQFVWDEFLTYFEETTASRIPSVFPYYLAHIPWHGDILAYGELPNEDTKRFVRARISKFGIGEVVKLLKMIDEEEGIARGTVGQSVEAVVSSLENSAEILRSIVLEDTFPIRLREYAGLIMAMNWPLESKSDLERLVEFGSENTADLIAHLRKWGAVNPYG